MNNIKKEQIQELITRYKNLSPQKRKDLNEAQSCKDFILPLFGALGWDVYSEEVSSEENVAGKRADYTLNLNGVSRFFLEAKKPSVDIGQEVFGEQAISYAWHKSVPWAVLTNFESLRVYSAEWDEVNPERSLVFEIEFTDYDTSDKLALLSREAIERGDLDQWAKDEFRKPKRENVDTQLAKDLLRWRNVLFDNLKAWNSDKKINDVDIAKAVQTLLDRLIFMRTTEDRKIENEHLREILRNYQEGNKNSSLEEDLKSLFRNYDDWYNSKLFEEQLCDGLEYENSFLETVISELYKNNKGIRYKFDEIDSDVLGSIYEQYLGHIQQGDTRNSKRKQQGIYYTPRYIVDFIVRNTVGELVEGKSAKEIAKIRVVDPACGSGSFLTRAFEAINRALRKHNGDDPEARFNVIPKTIYGVDLDDEAVEIAQLNLLLRMVYKRERLPNLRHNIEPGNSLISGTGEQLKELKQKYGTRWKERRPFDWQKQFNEVFESGGFDVIIGNPPYIKEYVDKSAFDGLHSSPYYQGKMDIWTLFACQAIDHLKDGGYFSFIAPNNWLTNAGASIFRDKVLGEGEIVSFIDFGNFKVFKDAGIQTMIFVFRKGNPQKKYKLKYSRITDSAISENKVATFLGSDGKGVPPEGMESFEIDFEPTKFRGKTISFSDTLTTKIIKKIESEANFQLSDKDLGQGIVAPQEFVKKSHLNKLGPSFLRGDGVFVLSEKEVEGLELDEEESDHLKPYYTSEQVNGYKADPKTDRYIIYADKEFRESIGKYPKLKAHIDNFKEILTSDFAPYGLHRARDSRLFKGEGIFSLRKAEKPAFSYVNFPCYVSQSYYVIKPDNVNLKYLTALFNSKIANFWLRNRGKMQGDNLQIDKAPLLNFPIKLTRDERAEKRIVSLVDEVMKTNARLQKVEPILEKKKYDALRADIQKLEDKIDEEIYAVYNLSQEDISKIIQASSQWGAVPEGYRKSQGSHQIDTTPNLI
ncbi:MAG: N-6 DNA methylase [Candidatus Colwellbacteria bacterium]